MGRRRALVAFALVGCVGGAGCADDDPMQPVAPPPSTLSRVDAEPPGSRCPVGGAAIHTGRDGDGDGALSDAEIETTTYACGVAIHDVWLGDAHTSQLASAGSRAQLIAARAITGDLFVDNDARGESLPALTAVVGGVYIHRGIESVAMPALRSVGGDLLIDASDAVTIELGGLERIRGRLIVNPEARVERLALRRLSTVGDVTLGGALAEVDLRALRRIDGALTLHVAPPRLRLEGLTAIAGDLVVESGDLSLPALATVGGAVRGGPPRGPLHTVRLPALTTIGGELSFVTQPALEVVALPSLMWVGAGVALLQVPALTSLDLSRLQQTSRDPQPGLDIQLHIQDTGLVELSLPTANAGYAMIGGNPHLRRLSLGAGVGWHNLGIGSNPELETLTTGLTKAGTIVLYDNPRLTRYGLDGLVSATTVDLNRLAIADLSLLPKLASVGQLAVVGCARLTSLGGLAARPRIDKLYLQHLDALPSLAALSPLDIAALHLEDVDALPSLAGLAPRATYTSLAILDNATLTSLDALDAVTEVRGHLYVGNNPALASLRGLEHVTAVGEILYVLANPQLADLAGLAALQHVGGLQVGDNPLLAPAEVDALRKRLGVAAP
jgi:hypothetical protein